MLSLIKVGLPAVFATQFLSLHMRSRASGEQMYVFHPNSLCKHQTESVLNVASKTLPTGLRTIKTLHRTTLPLRGKIVNYLKTKDTNGFSFAIPIIAYGFLGVEIVAMTAYEARDVKDLGRPSRVIAYVIFISYFFCAWNSGQKCSVEGSCRPCSSACGLQSGTGFLNRMYDIFCTQCCQYLPLCCFKGSLWYDQGDPKPKVAVFLASILWHRSTLRSSWLGACVFRTLLLLATIPTAQGRVLYPKREFITCSLI